MPPQKLSTYSPFTKIRTEVYDFGKGITFREVVERPDAVVIIARDDKDNLFFVKQHRYGAGKTLLEFPAGKIDPGRTPQATAQKEMQEEIGYKSDNMQLLGGFYASPGYSTEYLWVYYCWNLVESKLEGDEDDIEVLRLSIPEIQLKILNGEIEDSKTIAGFYLFMAFQGHILS